MQQSDLLVAVSMWIGQVGVLANHFKVPGKIINGKQVFVRDSECVKVTKFVHTPSASSKRKASEVLPRAAGDLTSCPCWLALRERMLEKMHQRDSAA